MATLKEIKTRIGGVKSTQKITKAMKMVAAAKLRRAQERIMQARPYAQKIDELLKSLLPSVETSLNVLLEKREVKNKKPRNYYTNGEAVVYLNHHLKSFEKAGFFVEE